MPDARGTLTIFLAAAMLFLCLPVTAKSRATLPQDVRLTLSHDTLAKVRAQLSSPIAGGSICSEFGRRHHPVLKRKRFHGGVDYIASRGTPVLAAGAGVIEKITRTRSHGLFVVIRHNERLRSGYAHLSATLAGLEVGLSVGAQGMIGAVGSSGRSSGPHLHFEVFVDGDRVDPRIALATPPMPTLARVSRTTPLLVSVLGSL